MRGQLPANLFAEWPDMFFLTGVDATLAFAAEQDSATAVTLSQNVHTIEFRRIL